VKARSRCGRAAVRLAPAAADALQQAMREHRLRPGDIARITAHVQEGAIDVLGPIVDPHSVHRAKAMHGDGARADRPGSVLEPKGTSATR
jgi:hypothetical protein